MIFIAGVILMIVAIIMWIGIIRKGRRPQADAWISGITSDYYEKDKNKLRKYPHANIKYVYESITYEAKIFLLKRRSEVGDQIVVSFKHESPEKPVMYAPKVETLSVIFMFAFGAALVGVSVFVMNYFNLW